MDPWVGWGIEHLAVLINSVLERWRWKERKSSNNERWGRVRGARGEREEISLCWADIAEEAFRPEVIRTMTMTMTIMFFMMMMMMKIVMIVIVMMTMIIHIDQVRACIPKGEQIWEQVGKPSPLGQITDNDSYCFCDFERRYCGWANLLFFCFCQPNGHFMFISKPLSLSHGWQLDGVDIDVESLEDTEIILKLILILKRLYVLTILKCFHY